MIKKDPTKLISTEFPCQSLATAEERERYQGRYKPDQEGFKVFISYLIQNPGKKITYEDYRRYKEGRKKV